MSKLSKTYIESWDDYSIYQLLGDRASVAIILERETGRFVDAFRLIEEARDYLRFGEALKDDSTTD